jgi:hypothetical protein
MTLATNQPQTIIRKKAGHLMDKEYLETALRKCPTVSGYAIRDVTDGVTTLETDQSDHSATIEGLMGVNAQIKDYDAVFYLANITQNGLTNVKDNVQPFEFITRDADKPDDPGSVIVSFFVEGDLPKHSDPASGHTDEYNFAEDVIFPLLQEIMEDAEGDIGKFIAKLHKPSFEKTLMAYVGHRAAFVFLPLEGDAIEFGKNALGTTLEWGTVSQQLGYGDADQEPAPITKTAAVVAAVKKKFDPFGKKGAVAPAVSTDDKGIHHVGATTIVDVKKDPIKAIAESGKNSTVGPKGKIGVSPPKGLEGTARNHWIRLFNNNKLPDNHLRKDLVIWVDPDMAPFAQRPATTILEVKNLSDEIRTGNKPSAPKDMKDIGPAMKQAQAEIAKANTSPADYIPTLDDKEMTEATGILAGFIDRDKVPSFLEIQKMEAPWPVFSEKMGIPFADTLRWRVGDELKAVFKGNKIALLLFLEMRRKYIESAGTDKIVELVGKDVVKKETEKHVEAKTALAPKKNLLFGKKSA